jgi:dihydroorotase
VGSETAYALTVTELVRKEKLTMTQLVERMSVSPAKILGISKGSLQVGMAADITIADTETAWVIDPEKFYSKGKNTPFAGKEVYGKVYYTIVDGNIAFTQE